MKLFESFWSDGVLFLWKLDKEFNSLKGDEVKRFLLTGPAIADLLLKCLENVTTLIDQFKKNIITFYDVRRTSFMKDKHVSDHETYYLYYLRFYIPKISRHTCKTHECGIGIYSMQEFERKNKESKNCIKLLTTINNIGYHRVCVVFGIYSFRGKRRNKERSIKVIKSNYIIRILLLQLYH